MRTISYILIGLCVIFLILSDPALAVFCGILGVGLLIGSSGSKNTGEKQPAAKKPAAKNAAKKPAVKKPAAANNNSRSIPVPFAPAEDAYAFQAANRGSQHDYFALLLSRCFAGYTCRINVPVTELFMAREEQTDYETVVEDLDRSVVAIPTDVERTLAEPPQTPSGENFHGEFANVTFLMCQGSQPRLAVMLGKRNFRETHRAKNTQNHLAQCGIPCQFYIDSFRNKASYVYSRVSQVLK